MYPEHPVEEEHHLPFIAYDQYITAEGARFLHGCIGINQFVADKPVSVSAPYFGTRGDVDDDIELPCETGQHTLATEAGKNITRTMFEAVWCLVQTGNCFDAITRENVFVSPDGTVRFVGVRKYETCNIQEWKQRYTQNFRDVAAIGRDLFSEKGLPTPPEMSHLFDMVDQDINDQTLAQHIDLYHVHASGVPIGIGWLLYQKIFDHVMAKISKNQREDILRSLQPYMVDWRAKAQNNDLLTSTYVYRQGSYDLTDDRVAQIMEKDINHFLSLTQAEQKDMYLLAEAHKFMYYLRNRGAHRLGGLMDANSYYKRHVGKDYSAEGSDYLFQIRWAVVLCHIQKKLHEIGELSKLKVSHFLSGLYPKKETVNPV